jgi:magnesium transporter
MPEGNPESAAWHLETRVPFALETEQVEAVIARLSDQDLDSIEAIFVVDVDRTLRGAVPLAQLLRAGRGLIGELVDLESPRVRLHEDQEHVAAEALAHGATSVAVVDDAGRFLGAVTALSLLQILRREHVEDLHRLAGIQRETVRARSALDQTPTRRARHRLPWLIVGLAGSIIAASLMSGYERILEANLAIAFFVPAIVYLADAIGTQTEAIVVRGLSLSRLPLRHLLADELRTGVIMGTVLAALAFPTIVIGFGDVRLAASVAIAIVIAGTMATSIGLLLPWCLQRLGSDPAFGSGPVATIIQDVLSLVIYFAIASWLVG